MENGDKKYEDVINTLKSLQQVKAPPNFDTDLKRRLNKEKYAKEEKRLIDKIFVPSKLIPVAGLAAAAVVVFLFFNPYADDNDNPFMMQPKVREDIITIDYDMNTGLLDKGSLKEPKMLRKTSPEENKDKMEPESRYETMPPPTFAESEETALPDSTATGDEMDVAASDEITSTPPATGFAIRKSGLNFRQVKPNAEELKEIEMLKRKIKDKSKKTKVD